MVTAVNSVLAIVLVVLVGFGLGRKGLVDSRASGLLSTLVMQVTFPAALFVSMATTDVSHLLHGDFLLVFFLVLNGLFVLVLAVGLLAGWDRGTAAMFAFAGTFPNMAFMGIPYLSQQLGDQSLVAVSVGNVLTSLVMIPAVTFCLEGRAASSAAGTGKMVLRALTRPLVVAPVLGGLVAVSGLSLPVFLTQGLRLLGSATSPVALLALGLMMTRFHFRISGKATGIMAIKLIVQPLLAVAMIRLFGLEQLPAEEIVILIAMPTAIIVSMFAERFDCLRQEAVSAIVGGSILSVVTLVLFTVWAASL
ncbi:MAG: AEC family transporter [Negativicutes bacterium]|nr:AEC family transporter [Negativicutes bacterium]